MIKLRCHSQQDLDKVRKWNPLSLNLNGQNISVNTSKFTGNSEDYVVMFQAKIEPGFSINWLGTKHNQILTILLTHYTPLSQVRQKLPPGQKLKDLLEQHNGLPQQYQKYIITFHQEMQTLGQRFNLNINQWANDADLIICCWGEFMESPYQQKHIFQGQSLGEVFIHDNGSDVIGIQGRPCY
ncbi:MAG TPA: hypothetical protein ACFCUY_16855 [Xenococcaceae cyanobacterium]